MSRSSGGGGSSKSSGASATKKKTTTTIKTTTANKATTTNKPIFSVGANNLAGSKNTGLKTATQSAAAKKLSATAPKVSSVSGGLAKKAAAITNPGAKTTGSGFAAKAKAAVSNVANTAITYAKAADRAMAEGVNAVFGAGGGKEFEHNPYTTTDTGNAALNEKADWVGKNVVSWLLPVGGAAGATSKAASFLPKIASKEGTAINAVKAGEDALRAMPSLAKQPSAAKVAVAKIINQEPGLAQRAAQAVESAKSAGTGLAQRAAKTVQSTGTGLAARATSLASKAPTVAKVAVPLAVGGAVVNQAMKETNTEPKTPSQALTAQDQNSLQPSQSAGTGSVTPNNMTPSYGQQPSTGGIQIPSGTVNNMGVIAPNVTQPAAASNQNGWPDWMQALLDPNAQQQVNPVMPEDEQPEVEQPLMPDFNQQYQDTLALIDQSMTQDMGLSSTYLQSTLSQIDQLEAEITAKYKEMGSEIDPETQAALTELRSQLKLRQSALNEEMNRRGLLQSGIWADMAERYNSSEMDNETQLLASQLSNANNKLMDSLQSFASQRLNAMNTSMSNQMNIAANASNQKLNAAATLQNNITDWNQWWLEQQAAARTAEAKAAADTKSDNIDLMKWMFEQNADQTNSDRDYDLKTKNYELDKTKTDYDVNKPYYNPKSGSSSGAKLTASEKKNAYTADAYSAVDQSKAAGLSNEQIANNIMGQYSELTRYGVDPQDVIDYLAYRYPESSANSNWLSTIKSKLGLNP